MISLYQADPQPLPTIPRDYAEKNFSTEFPDIPPSTGRRSVDRPAEHGPHAMTTFERVFWVLGGLVLVAFWVGVLVQIGGGT